MTAQWLTTNQENLNPHVYDFSICILQNYNPGTSYYMIGLCRLARKETRFARKAFYQASNFGDSLAIKKLSFLENPNAAGHNLVRKKA